MTTFPQLTENHDVGERTTIPRHSIRQALAWTVAAELVRRHPDDAIVLETHPGGGQYDCVTVCARSSGEESQWPGGWRTIVDMNKEPGGHLTHRSWHGQSERGRLNWLEVLLSEDLRAEVIEPIERAEGWPSPSTTPSTVGGSIGVRVLAAFATRVSLSRKPWILLNGYVDSSGGDGGARDDLFRSIPSADHDRATRQADDLFGIPEYRYWFLVEGETALDGVPRLAVDTFNGLAYRPDGETAEDLLKLYREHSRLLDRVVSDVCPAAF